MILETRGVCKNFGRLAALVQVSFAVEEGEIFGIVGPNGAGKSTLFNCIAGLYRPTSGRIFFAGHEITGLAPDQVCRRGIARTFQIPATFHSLSIYDNIRATFGAGRTDHVGDILDFLGLAPQAHNPARNLDLYTTKLVMLGAALATNCRLLMLDEPMAGLSLVEIQRFLELLRRINEERHITVIIIEHLLDILVGIAHRMMVLHNGEVLCIGSPREVTRDSRVVEVYLGKQGEVPHA
jgi:branched-chain amino acid transport system ATP-binding protein